jgi:lipoate-protein ligase B
MRRCAILRLGLMDYDDALALQNRLTAARAAPDGIDYLLLVQHPHVFTLGTSGHETNLVWDEAERARRGVIVRRVDRGGDVTYHGPGQIVGYPIVQLPRPGEPGFRLGAVDHVRAIETMISGVIGEFGITGTTIPGLTGVWVETPRGPEKICAIGVRVNVRAVTKHGFALNVNTDLTYFTGIIPCGIHDKGVTSLAALLGAPVDESAVTEAILRHFARVFAYDELIEVDPASLSS